MRSLVAHFSGGTEISIETPTEPQTVYAMLAEEGDWLVLEDAAGEKHYLAKRHLAYLTFGSKKGIGFA
jgi:hypothetical protein